MHLVFIYGPPASGKLTVARELGKRLDYRLFHNHVVVDLACSLFDFGTPEFVSLRKEIWLRCFCAAAVARESLIFTFAPEATVDSSFINDVVSIVREEGGKIAFVELYCCDEVIEERIPNKDRARFGKISDLKTYRNLRDSGAFHWTGTPPEPLVRLDTSTSSHIQAAETIAERVATWFAS